MVSVFKQIGSVKPIFRAAIVGIMAFGIVNARWPNISSGYDDGDDWMNVADSDRPAMRALLDQVGASDRSRCGANADFPRCTHFRKGCF